LYCIIGDVNGPPGLNKPPAFPEIGNPSVPRKEAKFCPTIIFFSDFFDIAAASYLNLASSSLLELIFLMFVKPAWLIFGAGKAALK
jgi:hypothetical protein